MSFIQLRDISKTYAGSDTAALKRLTLAVRPGEIVVLLGPSGCGKTTTLRLIAGFEQPDNGQLHLRGQLMASHVMWMPPEKRRIGMVFQDYALFPHLSIGKNIMFGVKGLTKEEHKARLDEVLELVGLAGRENDFPHQISGGQAQRVALARALAPKPDILLMDEPLSNLDADLRVRMRGELDHILRKAGTTTVMVTHDQEDAFALADRVAILNEGVLEQIGTPEQIYHEPATRFVADFVGQADFVGGTVGEDGVVTPLGIIPAQHPFALGEELDVMIRPDDVSVTPFPSGNATVVERQFRGSEIVYRLRLSSDEVVSSVQPSHMDLPVGAVVTASAEPFHIVLFNKATGAVHSCRHHTLDIPHRHFSDEGATPRHLMVDAGDSGTGHPGAGHPGADYRSAGDINAAAHAAAPASIVPDPAIRNEIDRLIEQATSGAQQSADRPPVDAPADTPADTLTVTPVDAHADTPESSGYSSVDDIEIPAGSGDISPRRPSHMAEEDWQELIQKAASGATDEDGDEDADVDATDTGPGAHGGIDYPR